MFGAGTIFDIQPFRKQPLLKFLTGRTGRLPCPALEGIRERTNLAVAEQPSNLRDRQVPVRKISLGEIHAKFLQHPDKRQTLRCKMSGKSSLAHAELLCNILRVRFAVRQEWHNGVLDPQRKCISI